MRGKPDYPSALSCNAPQNQSSERLDSVKAFVRKPTGPQSVYQNAETVGLIRRLVCAFCLYLCHDFFSIQQNSVLHVQTNRGIRTSVMAGQHALPAVWMRMRLRIARALSTANEYTLVKSAFVVILSDTRRV